MGNPWIGDLDEVMYWTRELSASEVDSLYTLQTQSDSPAPPAGFTVTPVGRNMAIVGDATIAAGVGLDLTANTRTRAMGGGTFTLMNGFADDRGALTPEACISRCNQDGYEYAGLQNGMECWCDNSYDSAGEYTPTADETTSGSDGCSAPCVGDDTRTCGGGWRNSVYSTAGAPDCSTGYVHGTVVDGQYTASTTCPAECTLTEAVVGVDGTIPSTESCVNIPFDVEADNLVTLDLASHPGMHVMVASATAAGGWNGGWWEVTVDGDTICGGQVDGLVEDAGDHFGVCVIVAGSATRTVLLNIHTGADVTGMSWHMDEDHTSDCETVFVPGDSSSCPAGCSYSSAVVGETCGVVLSEVPADSYLGCYNDHPSNSFAFLRNLDEFAMSGRFTISFWFSHQYCTNEEATSPWEALFSTSGEHCDAAHADGCEPQEIGIYLRCHASTALMMPALLRGSGESGTVLRLIMRDDANQLVQTDLLLGGDDTPDLTDGLITRSWVHYALVVDKTTVGQFVDGTPVQEYGFARFAGAMSLQNLAWHNASDTGIEHVGWQADGGKIQLRGAGLTTFNFTDTQRHRMTLGFNFGPWGGSYFNGHIANVGLWRRAIDDSEVSCLYKYGESHLGVPPSP
jgi:hypothetical protein